MKKLIFILILFHVGLVSALGQTTMGFNYQAVIRDANGDVITNQEIGLKVTLLQASATGTTVYSETFTPETNAQGLINIVIGTGQVQTGDFSTIDWSTADYFIKIAVDGSGGSNYTEMGTTQLLSVPYANYAFSGNDGQSAYEVWLEHGNTGTEEDFINSLTGPAGDTGVSAYEVWLEQGNTGTEEDFINSLKGPAGDTGVSAYEVWLEQGNTGTEEDFINSLTGPAGDTGMSAYEVWLDLGNTGTEEDFVNSLTGPSGTSSWNDHEQSVTTNKNVGIGNDTSSIPLQITMPKSHKATEPIFEVKNSAGKTVFAVYENDVKVFIDEDTTTNQGAFTVNERTTSGSTNKVLEASPEGTNIYVDSTSGKDTRGGFAISGRGSGKATTSELFKVTPGLTEIFVDATAKDTRGGFAISGRGSGKLTEDILHITPEFTQFYVDTTSAKDTRGGFAISGRGTSKATGNEIFRVTPGLTEVFVEEPAKDTRGGFAISGRGTSKSGLYDIMTVEPHRTDIYLKSNSSKSFPEGFSISGLDEFYQATELFNVSDSGTIISTDMMVAPKVSTSQIQNIGQSYAEGGGAILDSSGYAIVEKGIVYNRQGSLNLSTVESIQNPAEGGVILAGSGTDPFSGLFIDYLRAGTTYQVRAFATNSEGLTGYGPEVTFTTLAGYSVLFNINDQNGDSIYDAQITLESMMNPLESITNDPGDYNFTIAGGDYEFRVSAPGFADTTGSIYVVADGDTFDLTMQPGTLITFNVVDENIEPVDGANIYLSSGFTSGPELQTDNNGVAEVRLTAGPWDYYIEYPGLSLSNSIEVVEGVAQTLTDTLLPSPAYTVTFVVTNSLGDSLSNAEVYLTNLNKQQKNKGIFEETKYTDTNGEVIFTNVPEGNNYWYYINHTDGTANASNLSITQDTTFEVQVMSKNKNDIRSNK